MFKILTLLALPALISAQVPACPIPTFECLAKNAQFTGLPRSLPHFFTTHPFQSLETSLPWVLKKLQALPTLLLRWTSNVPTHRSPDQSLTKSSPTRSTRFATLVILSTTHYNPSKLASFLVPIAETRVMTVPMPRLAISRSISSTSIVLSSQCTPILMPFLIFGNYTFI